MSPARLAAWPLPQPAGNDDKEARGRVVVIGGAREVPGAALLAGLGALRAGAGKLQLAVPGSVATAVAIAVPEARVVSLDETADGAVAATAAGQVADLAADAQAVVLGPGMVNVSQVLGLLRGLVERCGAAGSAGPVLVLDAAAIDSLTEAEPTLLHALAGRVVLTPNAAEAAFVLGRDRAGVDEHPLDVAREMAERWQAVVALKGATTCTAAPDGTAWTDDAGNVGLATSGSGDVLSGIVGGLAARGADPLQATVWGVHAHAVAGERLAERIAPIGYLARELLDEVAGVLGRLERGG